MLIGGLSNMITAATNGGRVLGVLLSLLIPAAAFAQTCPINQAVPTGTSCGVTDFSTGGPVGDTDTMILCQQGVGGCPGNASVVKLNQQPMSGYATYFKNKLSGTPPITYSPSSGAFGLATDSTLTVVGGQLHVAVSGSGPTIPSAALLSGNGTSIGTVGLGTGLSMSGIFPNQTLTATASGGVTPSAYGGTMSGSGGPPYTAYTGTAVPSGFVNTANYQYCAQTPTGAANAAGATLAVGGQPALPINVQFGGGAPVPSAGGEIGGNGQVQCFQLNSTATAWVLYTQLVGSVTSTSGNWSVTPADWAMGASRSFSAPATVALPASGSLSASGAIVIYNTRGARTSFTTTGGDTINGLSGPNFSPLGPNALTVVTTDAAGHFFAPSGPAYTAVLSVAPGIDPSSQAIAVMSGVRTVTDIRCRVDVQNGSAATVVVTKAASGTDPAAGTNLTDTASCNVNSAPLHVDQSMTTGTTANWNLSDGDALYAKVSTGSISSSGLAKFWIAVTYR